MEKLGYMIIRKYVSDSINACLRLWIIAHSRQSTVNSPFN
jgi:hypothetical protein